MADDPKKQDNRDRSRVAAGQDYEVAYFAKRHKLTTEQAEKLIREHGNNRVALEQAAQNLGRRGAGGSNLA